MSTRNLSTLRLVTLTSILVLIAATGSTAPIFTPLVSAGAPDQMNNLGPGTIAWSKTYGPGFLYSIAPTSDGGFIAVGITKSWQGWAVKLDAQGSQMWSKTYAIDTWLNAAVEASDGNYIIAGYDGTAGWVLKLDPNGNEIWNKTYGSSGLDGLASIAATDDGGAIVGGNDALIADQHAASIGRLDAAGNVVWTKSQGGSDDSEIVSIVGTSDGNYVAAAQTWVNGLYVSQVGAAKLDPNGNRLWGWGRNTTETRLLSIAEMNDGSTIAVGSDRPCLDCDWYGSVSRLDSEGKLVCHKGYWASWGLSQLYGAAPAGEAAVVVGWSDGCGPATGLAAKLDANGNELWRGCYGDAGAMLRSVIPTSDGGYIASGSTGSPEGWVLKWKP